MSKINDNIDICTVYQYAHAQSGKLDYLYSSKDRWGQGHSNIKLENAMLKINEELQGDETNEVVEVLTTLESIKQDIEKLQLAHQLLTMSVLSPDEQKEEVLKVFKQYYIPTDINKIKAEIGRLTTQYEMRHAEFSTNQEAAKSKRGIYTPSVILDNIATLNLVLEGKYIEAQSTSMRDFMNYNKLAAKKAQPKKD